MRDEPGETSLQEISLWPVCYFYFLFFGKGREGKGRKSSSSQFLWKEELSFTIPSLPFKFELTDRLLSFYVFPTKFIVVLNDYWFHGIPMTVLIFISVM